MLCSCKHPLHRMVLQQQKGHNHETCLKSKASGLKTGRQFNAEPSLWKLGFRGAVAHGWSREPPMLDSGKFFTGQHCQLQMQRHDGSQKSKLKTSGTLHGGWPLVWYLFDLICSSISQKWRCVLCSVYTVVLRNRTAPSSESQPLKHLPSCSVSQS